VTRFSDPGRNPPVADLFLLGVAIVAVSTSALLIREAAAPALAVAFWRTALAAGLLGTVTALRPKRRAELVGLERRPRRASVAAGLLLAAHFATWIPSLSFTTVASSVALVATQPVWAAVIASILGQRIPGRAWAGIAVALAGVLVLSGVDFATSGRALFGDALALTGGILAAAYVTVGASVRQAVSTTVYTTLCYSTAAIVLLAVAVAARDPLAGTGYDGGTWACLVAITLGPQLLGHSLINRVLRTISPTVVSVAILGEIVGSAFMAWAAFGESPPAGAYPAAVLIAAGVYLARP
jgi:drug/metabolite transporter (DMT)-like permease